MASPIADTTIAEAEAALRARLRSLDRDDDEIDDAIESVTRNPDRFKLHELRGELARSLLAAAARRTSIVPFNPGAAVPPQIARDPSAMVIDCDRTFERVRTRECLTASATTAASSAAFCCSLHCHVPARRPMRRQVLLRPRPRG